ncbi:unnamed protein product [Leptidea sinapis]|nr:unnamed protein product [Leptidea sinapis]
MATLFWCKVFKAPELPRKHHIVGYQPLIDSKPIRNGRPVAEKDSLSPVHHMVLYECAGDQDKRLWNEWSEGEGFFGPSRPGELATCVTPIAAWAMGSKGEFLPENVGIPLGGRGGVSFYMLEVHYDNQALHEGAGIGVSALHVIPPKQHAYRTTMPEEGINIVSVLLHAHGTAKKISLKHIRGNDELPRISEENTYDARYQQSRIVPGGRRFFKGDTLITECTYDSTSRDKPILGGYSASQLAGCYSMTPVVEFFEAFGIKDFYGLSMMQVEKIFLSSGSMEGLPQEVEAHINNHSSDETAMQGDDQGRAY